MRFKSNALARVGLGALWVCLPIACSNNDTAPASALLSQSQADSIGEAMSFDAEDETAGATTSGVASASTVASALLASPPQCVPTRTPASPTDTDGDGLPDSVRFDFS